MKGIPHSQDALDTLEALKEATHIAAARSYGNKSVWGYSNLIEWLDDNISMIEQGIAQDNLTKALIG